MASLSDVAKGAGVSLTTASLVLNRPKQPNRVSEGCAQRVREVAEKLGYIPNYHARSMKLGRAENIAVALDVGGRRKSAVSELTDAYFNQLIGGVELHLRSVGYQLTIIGPDAISAAPERAIMGIGQRRFDGAIILGAVIDLDKPGILGAAPDVPAVVIEYSGQTQWPVVDYDEVHGIDEGLKHLVQLGHRRILWVGPRCFPHPARENARERIVKAAAAAQGVQIESCTFDYDYPKGPGRELQMETGEAAMTRHLKQYGRTFTAVFAYNDPTAIGVCSALANVGLNVPADVSVIGFDDAEAPFCIPRLTTISHKLGLMGKTAMEMLMNIIADEASRQRLRGTRHVIKPELVVRNSTAPVKI